MNDGFVSVVRNPDYPGKLMIRARNKAHLESIFPKKKNKIINSKKNDYAWRMFVDEEEFAQMMKERILNIDYSNFKNSVVDNDLHDLYADFWGLHYGYQMEQSRPPTRQV